MAERVTMWKSKNGKYFESSSEAEAEDRALEMIEVFNGLPDDVSELSFEVIARYLAGEGYRITNINPIHASDLGTTLESNMSNEISNYDDVIDSRDVMKRIDELEGELQDSMEEFVKGRIAELQDAFQTIAAERSEGLEGSDTPVDVDDVIDEVAGEPSHFLHTEANALLILRDGIELEDYINDAARDSRHDMYEEATEYRALLELCREAEGCGDWRYGETLVRDSYFANYAQQLAEDIGAVNANASWPNNCIDWAQAARELKMDYTAVDFDGVTYWLRS